MPSASVAVTSAEMGPGASATISFRTSLNARPVFATSEGLVVTPSHRPRASAFLISPTSAESMKNCMRGHLRGGRPIAHPRALPQGARKCYMRGPMASRPKARVVRLPRPRAKRPARPSDRALLEYGRTVLDAEAPRDRRGPARRPVRRGGPLGARRAAAASSSPGWASRGSSPRRSPPRSPRPARPPTTSTPPRRPTAISAGSRRTTSSSRSRTPARRRRSSACCRR